MAKIVQKISVEVAKPNFFQAITAKQNDCNSRFLKATFVNEGAKIDVSDATKATINARRSDGEAKCFVGEVNTDGTVTVPLHSWILEIEGKVDCDITTIDKNDEKLTSTKFTVFVEAASFGSGDITNDPQKDLLLEVLESFNNLGDLSNVGALLDKKADKDTTYTKTETDKLLSTKASNEYLGLLVDVINEKEDKGHNHDDRYYTESEVDKRLNNKADSLANDIAHGNLEGKLNGKVSYSELNAQVTEVYENIATKANKQHDHNGLYYSKSEIDSKLTGSTTSGHNHDDRYYTETEVNDMLSAKANTSDVKHTSRMPSFEEIDNSAFIPKITACAATWLDASSSGEVKYGSLKTDDTDNMATRVNPMLYAKRTIDKPTPSDNSFTSTYRDVWADAKAGEQKTVNCITLCNMLVMGVPYKGSRLNGHENAIGMSGYAFDIFKVLGNPLGYNNRPVDYYYNKKLDITTFQSILTQVNFFDAYSSLGLVRTVKSETLEIDGQILYSDIRPGDVLWAGDITNRVWKGKHSLLCLSVTADGSGNVTVSGVDATESGDVGNFSFTVKSSDEVEGLGYDSIGMVARPYYSYVAPEGTADNSDCKKIKGPYKGIAAETDLNTILTVGEYRCISSTNVSSLVHKPSDLDSVFRLTVENLTKDGSVLSATNDFLQTIVSAKGEVYTRIITTYNHSVADPYIYPWRKQSTKDHTVRQLTTSSDLNEIVRVGEYRCMTNNTASQIANRPSGMNKAFRMIVDNIIGDTFTVQNGTYFVQRICDISGKEYYRKINCVEDNITFDSWYEVNSTKVETVT